MIGSIYKCKCGAEKKDANHWYVTVKGNGSVQFLTWEAAKGAGVLQLPETVHICGELHAHVELSEFFAAEMVKKGAKAEVEAESKCEVCNCSKFRMGENGELECIHCAGVRMADSELVNRCKVDESQQELPFAAEKEANESICVEFNSSGS